MVGTTADKKKEKVIKVKGWKQYYDQVQFEMLVSGLDKSMLLLTDPAWNMYAIDMMADNAWQADTIFACNLISELSKLLLPAKVTHHIPITSHHITPYDIISHLMSSHLILSCLKYKSFDDDGVGTEVPSLELCKLSINGETISLTKPERETSTKYTCGCEFAIKARYYHHHSYYYHCHLPPLLPLSTTTNMTATTTTTTKQWLEDVPTDEAFKEYVVMSQYVCHSMSQYVIG